MVFADGDEGSAEAADVGRCHYAAFFDVVVEYRYRRGRAGRARLFEPHLLEYLGDAVAYRGRRREREVYDSEGDAEAFRRFARDELADARYAEGGLFDCLAECFEVRAVYLFERALDDAGAAYADVYRAVALADAVEGPRHEWVVLYGVAEDDEFRAAERVLVLRQEGRLLYDRAHLLHRVHVDAGAARAEVDGGADALSHGERLGDGVDELLVGGRGALLDERGESAYEVDADLRRGAVERARYFHVVVRLAASRRYRDRRHGNSLVDYRDAELERDFVADAHEVLRPFRYPVVYFLAEFLFVGVGAVE